MAGLGRDRNGLVGRGWERRGEARYGLELETADRALAIVLLRVLVARSGSAERGVARCGWVRRGGARHGAGNSRLKIGNSLSPSVMARLGSIRKGGARRGMELVAVG